MYNSTVTEQGEGDTITRLPAESSGWKRSSSLTCFRSGQASKAAAIAADCLWDLLSEHHLRLHIEFYRGHITHVRKKNPVTAPCNKTAPAIPGWAKWAVCEVWMACPGIITSSAETVSANLERSKRWPGRWPAQRGPRSFMNVWSKTGNSRVERKTRGWEDESSVRYWEGDTRGQDYSKKKRYTIKYAAVGQKCSWEDQSKSEAGGLNNSEVSRKWGN